MGRFNAETYDPKMDSSHGTSGVRGRHNLEGVVVRSQEGRCLCGCGETVGSKFKMGHDARFKGVLIRAHITSTPIHHVNPGDDTKVVTRSAIQVAKELGWDSRVREGANRYANRPALVESSKTGVPRSESGLVGQTRKIKVGRWEHTATVTRRIKGNLYELEYTPKSGGTKTVQQKLS